MLHPEETMFSVAGSGGMEAEKVDSTKLQRALSHPQAVQTLSCHQKFFTDM